jgi:DNA-binding transcriptional LysR family regulator
MSRPPPPLTHVRSFECAARHLSFTAAARELGVTQAAVSQHVRMLERHIGQPLFTRRARSLILTEAGRGYLQGLRPALDQIDRATEAVVAGALNRSVVVSCPISLAENRLAPILRAFTAAHPDIDVLVQATIWDDADPPAADIAITIDREEAAPPDAAPLWPERLMLLCAPQDAPRLTAVADMARLPPIVVLGRQELWSIMTEALEGPRVNLDGGLKTNATNVALEMAANGLGMTVGPSSLSALYLTRGLLVEPFDVRPPSPWRYHMRMAAQRPGAMAALLRRHIEDSVA